MDFIALDVETANADLSSICQVGIAGFCNGRFHEKWESLVNPEDEFDAINAAIHGIDASMVTGAPTFPLVQQVIWKALTGTVVVTHTSFDQAAMRSVSAKHGLELPPVTWLDTARVVRRTWPDLSKSGYGLAAVAERLGIEFQHHNAAEDARAAGEILLRAMHESGLSVEEWLVRVRKPITPPSRRSTPSEKIAREGNAEGPLYGEIAVFTGALSMPRGEAADLAAAAGCEVAASVTKATTLLIVGDQDIRKLAGHEKSSKHRKAEKLIQEGQAIRILQESDLRTLVALPIGET